MYLGYQQAVLHVVHQLTTDNSIHQLGGEKPSRQSYHDRCLLFTYFIVLLTFNFSLFAPSSLGGLKSTNIWNFQKCKANWAQRIKVQGSEGLSLSTSSPTY